MTGSETIWVTESPRSQDRSYSTFKKWYNQGVIGSVRESEDTLIIMK